MPDLSLEVKIWGWLYKITILNDFGERCRKEYQTLTCSEEIIGLRCEGQGLSQDPFCLSLGQAVF